ncbi:hypothetical protein BC332_34700 [Capsicum chinense]|nr:hypothetical protein BC332_34700 [Capsicum chinense]
MHKKPIKKLPVARKLHFPEIPVSHSPSTTLSTPKSSSNRSASSSMSPPLNSTARVSFHAKVKRRKSGFGFGVLLMRLIFGLTVVFGLELGFSWMVSGFLKHRFSMEMIKNLSEKSFWDTYFGTEGVATYTNRKIVIPLMGFGKRLDV